MLVRTAGVIGHPIYCTNSNTKSKMINNYNNKITINYSNREIYLMNLSNKSNIKMFLYVCISVVKKIISGFNTEAWSKICNIVMLVYHLALSYIIVVVILKLCSLILLRSLRM